MIKQFNYSSEAANKYLPKIAQESTLTDKHKGFTIVPQKFHRCYGMTGYEKLILIDLWAYMGDTHHCFPSLETIARNLGCSSKTVDRHIHTLEEKKLVLIGTSQRNNTYYLPNDLHKNPYLLMSEKTHEFISEVRNTVNDSKLSQWINTIVNGENYNGHISDMTRAMKLPFGEDDTAKRCLLEYNQYLKEQYAKEFKILLDNLSQ